MIHKIFFQIKFVKEQKLNLRVSVYHQKNNAMQP